MPKFDVTLTAIFDSDTNRVTLSGMGPAPARPASIPENLWTSQVGIGFELPSFSVSRNLTVPTATYIVPDSNPVERRRVEYRDGAWQMPGTLIPEGTT